VGEIVYNLAGTSRGFTLCCGAPTAKRGLGIGESSSDYQMIRISDPFGEKDRCSDYQILML